MPPVSHGNTPLSMAPNLVRHPLKASVVRGTRMRRGSTFTPPRHAANAARCGLFLLRRSYLGKTTFRRVGGQFRESGNSELTSSSTPSVLLQHTRCLFYLF